MRIDIENMHTRFHDAQRGKESAHTGDSRLRPSPLRYDYLVLRALAEAIHQLVASIEKPPRGAMALDLGSCRSPYKAVLEAKGYTVRTLDITRENGADFAGVAEATGLPDGSFDLVLCTQVLEHCNNPWLAAAEIRRILRPAGHAIISVPHVWFYHPHPHDHWRFTQEGLVRLCRDSGLHPLKLLAQGGSVMTAGQIVNFMMYGVLGRWGAPLYLPINKLAGIVDKLAPNDLFCLNFACMVTPDNRQVRRQSTC